MNEQKQWSLLAYDVRDKRRLQRLHYYLAKRATLFQYSVFLVHKTPRDLAGLLRDVQKIVHSGEDDLRLYPVSSPTRIWQAGIQAARLDSTLVGEPVPRAGNRFWQRLLGMGK